MGSSPSLDKTCMDALNERVQRDKLYCRERKPSRLRLWRKRRTINNALYKKCVEKYNDSLKRCMDEDLTTCDCRCSWGDFTQEEYDVLPGSSIECPEPMEHLAGRMSKLPSTEAHVVQTPVYSICGNYMTDHYHVNVTGRLIPS
jgi:hypothetical protein